MGSILGSPYFGKLPHRLDSILAPGGVAADVRQNLHASRAPKEPIASQNPTPITKALRWFKIPSGGPKPKHAQAPKTKLWAKQNSVFDAAAGIR